MAHQHYVATHKQKVEIKKIGEPVEFMTHEALNTSGGMPHFVQSDIFQEVKNDKFPSSLLWLKNSSHNTFKGAKVGCILPNFALEIKLPLNGKACTRACTYQNLCTH
jgi:hypothetical protein